MKKTTMTNIAGMFTGGAISLLLYKAITNQDGLMFLTGTMLATLLVILWYMTFTIGKSIDNQEAREQS